MEKDTSIKRILDTPHSSVLLAKVYFQVIYKTYFPTESNPHFMSVPDIQPVSVPGKRQCCLRDVRVFLWRLILLSFSIYY